MQRTPAPLLDMKRLQVARKRTLRSAAAILVLLAVFNRPYWPAGSLIREGMIWMGVFLIVAAISGRVWVIANLGRRKRWGFVLDGPYSVVRHPLYLFSIIGTAGAAAQTTSASITLAATLAVSIIFDRIARIEESDMALRFGEQYQNYLARTHRFLPRPSLWRPSARVWADDLLLAQTFLDASLFAVAIPFYLLIRWLHDAHLIVTLWELP